MEMRVLAAVQLARSQGEAQEDSFIEFKRELPEPLKAARQIAALCNASRGDEVLWIVGIDPRGRAAPTPTLETQDWWPAVEKYFDEITPQMRQIIVSVEVGIAVLGLFFDSDRAPFVVTTDRKGNAEREIPWRSGTRTRSIHRHELLKLLTPLVPLPQVELIWASVHASRNARIPPAPDMNRPGSEPAIHAQVACGVFVEVSRPTTFPAHRQGAILALDGQQHSLRMTPPARGGNNDTEHTVVASAHGIRVEHPGAMQLESFLTFRSDIGRVSQWLWGLPQMALSLTLSITGSEKSLHLECILPNIGEVSLNPDTESYSQIGDWRYDSTS